MATTKNKQPTAKDAILKIEQHESECSLRYKSIEQQLYAGSKKFDRIETMLWGVYPFVITVVALFKWL